MMPSSGRCGSSWRINRSYSAASFPWMAETAAALAEAIPHGEVAILDGQTHDVAPQVLAPAMVAFLTG